MKNPAFVAELCISGSDGPNGSELPEPKWFNIYPCESDFCRLRHYCASSEQWTPVLDRADTPACPSLHCPHFDSYIECVYWFILSVHTAFYSLSYNNSEWGVLCPVKTALSFVYPINIVFLYM